MDSAQQKLNEKKEIFKNPYSNKSTTEEKLKQINQRIKIKQRKKKLKQSCL